jgi:hypothetical protein
MATIPEESALIYSLKERDQKFEELWFEEQTANIFSANIHSILQ